MTEKLKAESKVKDGNYYVVQSFMVKDLKLKGLEKDVYAIIYGFSQAENQAFNSSLQYLADWTNSSKQGVMKCLKSLEEQGFIVKKENYINGVKFVEYYATELNTLYNRVEYPIQQSLMGGMQQSLPNNKELDNINNNTNNNINNISSSINTTTNKEKENKKEKENSTNLEIKGGVKAEIVRPEVLEIYNYWQSKKILNHKSLNDTLQKAIKKALKEYDVDTIKQSIDRYHTILLDKDYFFCYHWGLDKFLTQKNTLPEFLENGAKWVAYQATKNSSQPSKEKQNVSSIIDELLAESLGKEIEL